MERIFFEKDSKKNELSQPVINFEQRWSSAFQKIFKTKLCVTDEKAHYALTVTDNEEWQEFDERKSSYNVLYFLFGEHFMDYMKSQVKLPEKKVTHHRLKIFAHPSIVHKDAYNMDFDFELGDYFIDLRFGIDFKISIGFPLDSEICVIDFIVDDDLNVLEYDIIPNGDDLNKYDHLILDKNIMLNVFKLCYMSSYNKARSDETSREDFDKLLLELLSNNDTNLEDYSVIQEMLAI